MIPQWWDIIVPGGGGIVMVIVALLLTKYNVMVYSDGRPGLPSHIYSPAPMFKWTGIGFMVMAVGHPMLRSIWPLTYKKKAQFTEEEWERFKEDCEADPDTEYKEPTDSDRQKGIIHPTCVEIPEFRRS